MSEPQFTVGERIYKTGSGYSGPGIVRAVVAVPNGIRYVVGHKIDGGEGEFYHLYSAKELRRVAADGTA